MVYWVFSHNRLERNEKANIAAKKTAIKKKTYTSKWSCLSHIKGQYTKDQYEKLYKWYEWKKKEKKREE